MGNYVERNNIMAKYCWGMIIGYGRYHLCTIWTEVQDHDMPESGTLVL